MHRVGGLVMFVFRELGRSLRRLFRLRYDELVRGSAHGVDNRRFRATRRLRQALVAAGDRRQITRRHMFFPVLLLVLFAALRQSAAIHHTPRRQTVRVILEVVLKERLVRRRFTVGT